MQLNLSFLSTENENFGKTLAIFLPAYRTSQVGTFRGSINQRTVPFKYGAFSAYHPMKST